MRHSDVVRRVKLLVVDPDNEILLVGPKHLEQLCALAESGNEAAEVADEPWDAGYAAGVAGLLDWLLGQTPTTELAALLELEV